MSAFPVLSSSISVNPNGAVGGVQVVGISRGVRYRVVAEAACYLNFGAAASATTGMYVPANFPQEFVFGMSDSQGVDLKLFAFMAAGTTRVFFTPIVTAV